MRILEEFWYGNIESTEYDTSCNEYHETPNLISHNEEKLLTTMTDEQKELFSRYTDCVREFQTMIRLSTVPEQLQAGSKDDDGRITEYIVQRPLILLISGRFFVLT